MESGEQFQFGIGVENVQFRYDTVKIIDFKGDKLQFLVSESLPPKNITPHTIFDIARAI